MTTLACPVRSRAWSQCVSPGLSHPESQRNRTNRLLRCNQLLAPQLHILQPQLTLRRLALTDHNDIPDAFGAGCCQRF